MPKFNPGDRVAWSHEFAIYGEGTVLRESTVGHATRGTVKECDGGLVAVKFDKPLDAESPATPNATEPAWHGEKTYTLTEDELVRIQED